MKGRSLIIIIGIAIIGLLLWSRRNVPNSPADRALWMAYDVMPKRRLSAEERQRNMDELVNYREGV